MSAYMVSRGHVAYLVEAALHFGDLGCGGCFRWYWKDAPSGDPSFELRRNENEVGIGRMLWEANLASMRERYGPGVLAETELAEVQYDEHVIPPSDRISLLSILDTPGGRHVHEFNPVEVLKACANLDYQSCEYGGWYKSCARAFLDRLEREAIAKLPGYDGAEWGAPKAWEALEVVTA